MTIPRNTPQPVQDCPILQYASGKTRARMAGQGRFQEHVGFHVEIGRDEALDAALEALGTPRMEISHPRPGAQNAVVPHWSLGEAIRFHPVTAGPTSTTIAGCLSGLNAQATAASGIGLAWPEGERSRMAVRGLLIVEGQHLLIQLSVRSTMTGFLLAALLDHMRVCVAADTLVDRASHPDLIALHELALPLRSGVEVAVGRGETTQITPFVSGHPSEITREYVRSIWRTRAQQAAALAAWPGVLAWAAGYRSGETNGDSHLDGAVAEEVTPAARRRGQVEERDLPL